MTGFRDKNLELLIKETRSSTDEQLSASIGYIPEEFEPSKVDLLRKLFSNLDKPIFFFPYIGILSGAIGSMSSRAIGSLRKITSNLMDKNETFSTGLRELNIPDLINLLGENFFSRVFSGYGDDSIAQMVPAALVAENVSMFQAMRFLHHRTLAGIEKSTRYRRYDKRGSDGNYLYIVDNLIKAAGLEGHFRATIDKAFDIYSSLCDQKEGKGKLVIEGIKEKILPFGVFREEVRKALGNKSDRQADDSELLEAYDKTIRAMHLDTIRHALPLATSTLLALEVNSQNIRDIMFAGYSTPTAESVAVTELLRREAAKYAGPLIADVDPGSPDEKIRSRTLDAILYKHNTGFLGRDIKYRIDRSNLYYSEGEEKGFGLYRIQHCHGFVRVIDDLFGFEVEVSTKDTIDDLVAAIIAERNPGMSFADAYNYVHRLKEMKDDRGSPYRIEDPEILSLEQKRKLILEYAGISNGLRTNRRHKPGRAFENVYFNISIKMPIGEIRDIRRHRILTNFDPGYFTHELDFFISPVLKEIGLENELLSKYNELAKLNDVIAEKTNPIVASTALPLATNERMNLKINFRELHHILELRTQPGAHINYKRVCQMTACGINQYLNGIGKDTIKFLDASTEIDYGRAIQEFRTMRKLAQK